MSFKTPSRNQHRGAPRAAAPAVDGLEELELRLACMYRGEVATLQQRHEQEVAELLLRQRQLEAQLRKEREAHEGEVAAVVRRAEEDLTGQARATAKAHERAAAIAAEKLADVQRAREDDRAEAERVQEQLTREAAEREEKLRGECERLGKEVLRASSSGVERISRLRAEWERDQEAREAELEARWARQNSEASARARQLVDAARRECEEAKAGLERERQKIALLEVEARRQFEQHVRAFELQLRAKATVLLRQRAEKEPLGIRGQGELLPHTALGDGVSRHVQDESF